MRAALAILCALCESRFYRAVVEKVNPHVGRYTLFLLATSAGMWSASSGKGQFFVLRRGDGDADGCCPSFPPVIVRDVVQHDRVLVRFGSALSHKQPANLGSRLILRAWRNRWVAVFLGGFNSFHIGGAVCVREGQGQARSIFHLDCQQMGPTGARWTDGLASLGKPQ